MNDYKLQWMNINHYERLEMTMNDNEFLWKTTVDEINAFKNFFLLIITFMGLEM